MRQPAQPLSSAQPDPKVLSAVGIVQIVFLALATGIAGVILFAWLVPPLGTILPHSWNLMKVNTTLMVLGIAVAIFLTQPRRSAESLFVARAAALLVVCIGAGTLAEFAWHINLHIDTLFAADALSPIPGRPSVQTAITFLVAGIVLMHIRARKGIVGFLVDCLTLALSLMILTFFSGFLFGALRLYGLSLQTRIAPTTLLCMFLLVVTIFNRRAEYGLFSILIGGGIGGRTARLAAPWALLLPFTLSGARGLLLKYSSIPEEYCLALSASIMALFGFCLILVLSRRVNRLEHAIRELSLRDELTGLYNRRGFYVLAEQAHLLARRAGAPFFVLFVDLDYLKLINDALGHEVGSDRLKQVARILEQTFRETDVIGRLGGDEFVAAGRADAFDLNAATARLEQTSAALNAVDPSHGYPISFSIGLVVSPQGANESLERLIERADSVMYEAKRARKRARTQSGISNAWAPVVKSH